MLPVKVSSSYRVVHQSTPTTYMIQNVVPLLASGNLDKFSQEKWSSLGNGHQLGDVLGLALQAVHLQTNGD